MTNAAMVQQGAALEVEVTSPADGHKVNLNTAVKFKGTRGPDVDRVELWADGVFKLGDAKIRDGGWGFERAFVSSGLRNIEAIAFNAEGRALGSDRMQLHVARPVTSNERKRLVSITTSQIGLAESPLGSNGGAQIRKYFTYTGVPEGNEWCFLFLNWVFHQATGKNPPWGKAMAYVPSIVAWAKRNGRWIRENDPHKNGYPKGEPMPGDLIIMGDYQGVNIHDNYPHIEMVVQVGATSIITIGGNVSHRVVRDSHTRFGHDSDGRYIAGYVRTL